MLELERKAFHPVPKKIIDIAIDPVVRVCRATQMTITFVLRRLKTHRACQIRDPELASLVAVGI